MAALVVAGIELALVATAAGGAYLLVTSVIRRVAAFKGGLAREAFTLLRRRVHIVLVALSALPII